MSRSDTDDEAFRQGLVVLAQRLHKGDSACPVCGGWGEYYGRRWTNSAFTCVRCHNKCVVNLLGSGKRDELVRRVGMDGYQLELWFLDYERHAVTLTSLGYRLRKSGKLLFEGTDFGPSSAHAVDSDKTLRALLSFLTLKPGDVEASYFHDHYTDRQYNFACNEADDLYPWVHDDKKFKYLG